MCVCLYIYIYIYISVIGYSTVIAVETFVENAYVMYSVK